MKLLELWSGDVKTKKHPPEGLFANGSVEEISAWLKKSHKDLKRAVSALNFYVNRAGKNLSATMKKKMNSIRRELSEEVDLQNKSLDLFEEEHDLVELGKKYTGGNFTCPRETTSLEGAPQEVGGNFYCNETRITSLEGAPQEVGGDFDCSNTRITSLKGLPKSAKLIWLLTTYEGPILRLCLVKNLKEVYGIKSDLASEIINKYLNQGNAGLIRAQRELIENDLDEYARL